MKICRTCNKELPLESFGIKYKTYLQPDCKVCKRIGQKERTEKRKEWVDANRDKVYSTIYEGRRINPHKHRVQAAKSRSKRKQATIIADDWLNKQMITVIYLLSETLSKQTGVPHEVDHIVPISGKNVCGLHYWKNLQVLTRDENRLKSNH